MQITSIEEINKIVDIVLTDKDVQDELNNRILAKNLEDLKKRKAYEDGEKEKSKEIAKKMLEKGEDIEYIVEITGLTRAEIDEIKKKK